MKSSPSVFRRPRPDNETIAPVTTTLRDASFASFRPRNFNELLRLPADSETSGRGELLDRPPGDKALRRRGFLHPEQRLHLAVHRRRGRRDMLAGRWQARHGCQIVSEDGSRPPSLRHPRCRTCCRAC